MGLSSDEEEVRTFIEVISEKYNPDNFPYGQGVVVQASPPGSPIKGERWFQSEPSCHLSDVQPCDFTSLCWDQLVSQTLSDGLGWLKFSLFADRLFLPSALVLNDCGITKAGDRAAIAAFCAHVLELDLSYNQLKDWGEVGVLHRNTARSVTKTFQTQSCCYLRPQCLTVLLELCSFFF